MNATYRLTFLTVSFSLQFLLMEFREITAANDEVAGIVSVFVNSTLRADRFAVDDYVMQFRVTNEYPSGKPSVYNEKSVFKQEVSHPYFRLESIVGPFEPIGQPAIRYEAFWNGKSEVSADYDPQNRQNSVVITRSGVSNDFARSNWYMQLLGIPCTESDLNEASNGSYFLSQAVNQRNGYAITAESSTNLTSASICIRKNNEDILWFDNSNQRLLLRREVWRNSGTPHKEIMHFSDYSSDGLPKKIVLETYSAVNSIGEVSKLRMIQTLILEELRWTRLPDEHFIARIETGTTVLDTKSMTSFVAESADKPPFSKFLKQNVHRLESGSWFRSALEVVLPALLCTVSIFFYRRFFLKA